MQQFNLPPQRYCQVRCEEADESLASSERGPDLGRGVHLCGHPLQLEEDLAVVRRSGASIREGS
jgi:hypothetical protein